MDVTLGVSVAGTDARIVLLDAAPPHAVIDQSELDLTGEPTSTLVSTLVSTDRALTASGHRLVGTRVCTSGPEQATELTSALVDADLSDVSVVSRSDAVSAVARSLTPGETVASLTADADTAALSIVDADTETTSLIAVEPIRDGDRAAAYRTLLERFSEEPGGATSVIVIGGADLTTALAETTPIPLRFPEAPDFAVAHGAALAGFRGQTGAEAFSSYPDVELDAAQTMLRPEGGQLAYSQVDDDEEDVLAAGDVPMQTPMRPLSAIDPDEVESEADPAATRPRVLLLGSTVAAIVVVGFAALAVSVAISIRPTVSEQAIRMQQETVPGKYFPVSPGQGVNKDGENWTMVEQVPPPGTDTGVRTFETKPLNLARGTADAAGPRVIEVFRDGTVGVQNVAGAIPGGPPPIDGGPVIPDFVPRLIPDFSRVNMCQVLSFVGNLETLSERAVDNTVKATEVLGPTDGLSLDNLGKVAVVSSAQRELFDVDKTAGVVPGADTIPKEIFDTTKSPIDQAKVLPADTALIEELPATAAVDSGKSGGVPIFGKGLPDLSTVNVIPGGAEPSAGEPPITKTGTLPGFGPTESKQGGVPTLDTSGPIQGGLPGLDPTGPKQSGPLPGVDATAPKEGEILPKPGGILPPIFTAPKPPVTQPEQPVVTKPEPPIFTPPEPQISKPEAPIFKPQIPIVTPEAPIAVEPAPPVSNPEPVVAPPKPVIDLPIPKIFPIPAAPAEPAAPVEQAPAAPQAPAIPVLPDLPVLGGLFGSGQG
ncbi:hypothetical protein [Mycolicibacterium sp.]|uniref:hypothetical protein n=1 Tax=Mycolicibacterium sp. TaxID=2320850 RepID=UPI0037C505F9